MVKYDNDDLSALCDGFNLLEYAKNKYELKKIGRDAWAMHCPNHVDNTPSLVIDPRKNRFHCFSCGCGASPIDFLTKIEKMSFQDSVNYLANETGTELVRKRRCEALAFFKTMKRIKEKSEWKEVHREILPVTFLDQFSRQTPKLWADEDMDPEVLAEYEVMIDNKSNRIVYPIYDNNDNLIGAKGRTMFEDYKQIGISKYMNYTKIQTTDFFVGMKNNRAEIRSNNSVIVFEGIKSGLKYTSYGFGRNWLAAETSCINDSQIKILISLGIKEVIIAFDSDVKLSKIKDCTEKLRKFIVVYAIVNQDGLLGEKESPVDRGPEVYKKLLEKKVRL